MSARGCRRIRGQAALTVFVATLIADANLVRIAEFMARSLKVDSRGRGPEKKKPTRRRDRSWGPLAARTGQGPRAPGDARQTTA